MHRPRAGAPFLEEWPAQPPRNNRTRGGRSRPLGGHGYGNSAFNRNTAKRRPDQQVPLLRTLPLALPHVQMRKASPRLLSNREQQENPSGSALHVTRQTRAFKTRSTTTRGPFPAPPNTPTSLQEYLGRLTASPSPCAGTPPLGVGVTNGRLPSLNTATAPPPVDQNQTHTTTPPSATASPSAPGKLTATQRTGAGLRPMEQPLLRNDEWRRYPEVNIYIGPDLSRHVAIKDIFRTLKEFGDMETIGFELDRHGERNGNAYVRFSKISHPFWESGSVDFGFGPTRTIWRKPQGNAIVASRVNPSRMFPSKLKFKVESLEFGFMLQAEDFMAMFSSRPRSKITWEINLIKKKVEMTFILRIEKKELPKDTTSEVSGSANDETLDRTEIYMVEIPFTNLCELLVPADEDQNGTIRTFVIPLPDPPKYFRQLTDWSKSMLDTSITHWTIYDVWMRQTDIEYNMKGRQLQPVSLRHRQPVIDIGRWTTFRLSFSLNDSKKKDDFKIMMDAFKDFNIRSKPLAAFHVNYDKSQLTQIWSYLDQELAASTRSAELLEKPFLPFPVRYQLEVCISHGYLNEHNISCDFIDRLAMIPERNAVILLECVQENKTRFFDPMDVFSIPRDKRIDSSRSIPDTCVYMRRAIVTPTGILFQTPSVEMSNRVIRHFNRFADRFIRVSFTDEKQIGRIRFTDRVTSNELFSRVYRTLEKGIVIGNRCYEFLAFGNSQLREHGAYFFASSDQMTAQRIRDWMGDFTEEKVIAKHASRLGQCFSTTKAFKSCKVDCKTIEDITRNDYVFTDGVGMMSPVVARLLTEEMLKPQRHMPPDYQSSCFQFRLGGCKGVLAVSPHVPNLEIHLRPDSQRKFWSTHDKLEIIRCSQFAAASLNRQLIQVMSTLGVPDEFFRNRLQTILRDYTEAIVNPAKALELLTKHIDPNHMTLAIANLVREGFQKSQEPFVMSLLHLWRAWTIKYLKEKAKITIDDGAFLLGVVDETAKLKGYYYEDTPDDLPQIFCQVSDPMTGELRVIMGRCIVARNPSLHPGDVRIVEAVDVPELHHLVDVVAFPQTGDRDVPNMLSGGDLDGDDYVVIWDKGLTAPGVMTNEPPASYAPPKADKLKRNVEIKDIRMFFVDYMKNDRLGSIANAHLAWADKFSEGVKSNICIELANLHSDAVDYPKSGIKARMQKRHRVKQWPHFFDKPVEEGQYRSDKILGQLYDLVERVDFTPCYNLSPDRGLLNAFQLTQKELREAQELKADYDASMNRIMAQHDIKTEFEVWSTFVMSHSNSNDYKFHEEIGEISFALKERFRKEVMQSCTERKHELPRKVAAMYVVTVEQISEAKRNLCAEREKLAPRNKGKQLSRQFSKEEIEKLPLISFPWVFPDILINISQGRLVVSNDYAPGHCDVSVVLESVEEDPGLDFETITLESQAADSDVPISEVSEED